ncbi:hypothetical protein CDCA_CDCA13G3681 [Cyanidium caldarium]|uniref:Transcription initiation factor TFIID subunit 12 domain-containing protein n=1 Tax=Cyanidium caldarium TaxID=2771 RepID=A0AAV9J039_CYACA|nr:hypothetical protein CDCA_CDCA13G3681 [Cyanidium caldarium]
MSPVKSEGGVKGQSAEGTDASSQPPPATAVPAVHRGGPAGGAEVGSSGQLLPRSKLEALLEQVAPGEELEDEVVALLQEHVEDFVDNVLEYSCRFARHRKSRIVEARDVQLYLRKRWQIQVPGYGDDERPQRRREVPTHAKRLAEVRKQRSEYAANK